MYMVTRQDHPKYGNVIQILRDENGTFQTPGLAANIAITARRLWREEGAKKVRYLIDDQVMSSAQIEAWASAEYKNLPKCFVCNAILHGDVFTHKLCGENLFCSRNCSDRDYQEHIDKIMDEEEIDYL
jgi:hypothetical protein